MVGSSRWVMVGLVSASLAAMAAPALATGAAIFDCRPSLEIERKEMAALAKGLKEALAKNDRRRLQQLATAIPGARLTLVPGMGHDLPPPFWPAVLEAVGVARETPRPT